MATGAPLLVLKKLDKRFGATHALKAVDLVFEAGEIHAIVGENGAGKSTLINLLTGVHVRSSGEVYWEGKPVALATPHEAINHGINAVHQEVVLVSASHRCRKSLSRRRESAAVVCSNIATWCARRRRFSTRSVSSCRRARCCPTLTIGQQQLVATARASTRGTRFLIFDEPTAYLTRQEAGTTLRLDSSSQGQRGHHCLYFASAGRSVPARGPCLDPARRPRWCRLSVSPKPTRNG